MKPLSSFITPLALKELIGAALAEDLGSGDLTTEACVPEEARARARIIAKAPGVIAGQALAREVFSQLDPGINYEVLVEDGSRIETGSALALLDGRARGLLSGERTALNFLGHLSGIATQAARLVELTAGSRLKILDTRKTTPLLRPLEKYAVQAGGGHNHRQGLYDMILIKENHIRAAGGIRSAVERARSQAPGVMIEVETTDQAEILEALEAGGDRIMLDNMTDEEIRDCLDLIAGRVETEASGKIDHQRIATLARTGLDFVSVGALTHSVSALDLSLLFEE